MSFDKIGFIGLGLIGGSIAQTIKKLYPDVTIIATAGHLETITEAHQAGILANDTLLSPADFSDCDYIFLCTPVQKNIEYLEQLKPFISPSCIITDVGSVKSDIHEAVICLGMEEHFIGGHPMCGSEKTGFSNANDLLLENAYYVITPSAAVPKEKVSELENLVRAMGSVPLIMDYRKHDYATASISHLPHIIAASLVNLVKDLDDEDETMRTIAAGGFKDITRIASSSPVMWQQICLSNKTQILNLLDSYCASLGNIRKTISDCDRDEIFSFFERAKDYRDSINMPANGPLKKSYVVYCDLRDETGAIATIATIMASHNISIKNIGILHNREFEEGTLQIEFYDESSLQNAIQLLKDNHYQVYEH